MEKINILKLLTETNDNFIYSIDDGKNILFPSKETNFEIAYVIGTENTYKENIDNSFCIVICNTNNNNLLLNRFLNLIDMYYIVGDENYLIFKNVTSVEVGNIMRVISYYYKTKEKINLNYKIYKVNCYEKNESIKKIYIKHNNINKKIR